MISKHKFVFIIPSYNNADWYQYNLNSIFMQQYKNWRAIYVNDCSTDGTMAMVQNFVSNKKMSKRFTYIDNNQRMGPAGSRYQAYTRTDDEEICCMLDGDDWLSKPSVLNTLCEYYDKYNCTYGNYVSSIGDNFLFNTAVDYDLSIHQNKTYRAVADGPNYCTHLRTFQSKLIKTIDPNKYLKINNDWINMCTDIAESVYAMEQPQARPRQIEDHLYVYNVTNSVKYNTSYYNREHTHNKMMKFQRQNILRFIKNA